MPQVADRIRGDRIDILVDLALHTADNRMLVFARKPAPVQVTMLGLPATTGLATIDYRLTDPYLDPPGTSDADYTEQSIRLPHCFWCYQPAARLAAGRAHCRPDERLRHLRLPESVRQGQPAGPGALGEDPSGRCPARAWSCMRRPAVTAMRSARCSRRRHRRRSRRIRRQGPASREYLERYHDARSLPRSLPL